MFALFLKGRSYSYCIFMFPKFTVKTSEPSALSGRSYFMSTIAGGKNSLNFRSTSGPHNEAKNFNFFSGRINETYLM